MPASKAFEWNIGMAWYTTLAAPRPKLLARTPPDRISRPCVHWTALGVPVVPEVKNSM